ncbi:hypothetical protein ACFV16_22175 [Streptomyces massasporeus]|uniref:hypothetical protein n=1 Tax=Streptomyces massasporeus TaxID=67324 RepID=UPI003694F21C
MTTVQNRDERIADPGFTAAQDQNEAAIAELRSFGVPYDRAFVIVQRSYRNGLDRGLHLGLRKLSGPAAS